MALVIKVLICLFVVYAAYFFLGMVWKRLYYFEPGYDQVHFVATEDGWKLALHRYSPKTPGSRAYPVILCHGLGANRYNFDLGPRASLARFLQSEGYDVWILELRGRGHSARPRLFTRYRRSLWGFDDYVRKDMPAAIGYVRTITGSAKVHWIGHSMGGFALYAYLQGQGAHEVASGVAIGSPGFFRPPDAFPSLLRVMRILGVFPRLHVEFLSSGIAPLLGTGKAPLTRIAVNPDNVDRTILTRAICYLVSDIHKGELNQIRGWMEKGDFATSDGTYSYQANYTCIRNPLLLIAGAADRLANVQSILFVYERVASSMKRLLILGRASGYSNDYGHGDLLIGKACREEVYPLIAQWLEETERLEQRA